MLLYTIILLFSFDVAFAVIGGEYVEEYIPFMAALEINDGNLTCGGVIVNSKWILSSGECAMYYVEQPEDLTIAVGLNYLFEKGQRFQAKKVIIHPEFYVPGTDDLSLINIDGEIKFDDKAMAMEFPDADTTGGEKLQGYGFEPADINSLRLYQLQRVNVTALTNAKCNEMNTRKVPKEVICSTSDVELSGLCGRDAGGPLVDKNNKVVGITTVPRCSSPSATKYMKTFYYKDWILDNTKEKDLISMLLS